MYHELTQRAINIFMKIKELISEGGNMFRDQLATARIPRDLVAPTVAFLEQITGIPLLSNMLGSTGKAESSGDIDLAVDASQVSKDELISKLKAWANKNDPTAEVKKSGIQVHFRCPIAGKPFMNHVQVDFMFVDDVKFTHWVYRPQEESKVKNIARTILIASLARPLGLRFSSTQGLTNRQTGAPIKNGKNPDVIARMILGKKAMGRDLASLESIMNVLRNDPKREEKLEDARKTLPMYGVPSEMLE